MKSPVQLLEELLKAAERCREMQRAYYKERTYDKLTAAKSEEKRLDNKIFEVRNNIKIFPKQTAQQQSLGL